MNPKILHATISSCENERRIFNQAASIRKSGWPVKILALLTPGLPQIDEVQGIVLERIRVRRWQGGARKFIAFNLKLFLRLFQSDFAILHAHDLWVLPASALACLIRGKKLVYDAHEFYRGLEIFNRKRFSSAVWLAAEWLFSRFARRILAINSEQKELIQNAYPAIKQVEVIMNLPLRSHFPEKVPGFKERQNAVLFHGIFKPGRGLPATLHAWSGLQDVRLDLIGLGELEPELKRLAGELNLGDRVRFAGKMEWQHLLENAGGYRAGLVLFEPTSVNYTYAAPNKFFEYVAAGTPLIASDIPTFYRLLGQFEVGLLVNPQSPEQIADAVKRLQTDRRLWEHFHQNCLRARQVWNWEEQELLLLNIYRELSGMPVEIVGTGRNR